MRAVQKAAEEELTLIDEIGPKIAQSVRAYFIDEENLAVIDKLRQAGVKMIVEQPEVVGAQLQGMTFVLTGTLSQLSRREAGELITARGGKLAGSVSKNTDYVVAGEASGSKLIKAQELNIPILDEQAFLEMVQEKEK
jgi:DNA ligase (NAD+)